MTLIDLYRTAYLESELFGRITAACIVAGANVHAEDVGTPNHANRLIWALALQADSLVVARELFWSTLRDPSIVAQVIAGGAGITDVQIQAVVDGVLDDVADGSQAP